MKRFFVIFSFILVALFLTACNNIDTNESTSETTTEPTIEVVTDFFMEETTTLSDADIIANIAEAYIEAIAHNYKRGPIDISGKKVSMSDRGSILVDNVDTGILPDLPVDIDTNGVLMKYMNDYLYLSRNFDFFGIYQLGEKKYNVSTDELFGNNVAMDILSDGEFVFVKGGEKVAIFDGCELISILEDVCDIKQIDDCVFVATKNAENMKYQKGVKEELPSHYYSFLDDFEWVGDGSLAGAKVKKNNNATYSIAFVGHNGQETGVDFEEVRDVYCDFYCFAFVATCDGVYLYDWNNTPKKVADGNFIKVVPCAEPNNHARIIALYNDSEGETIDGGYTNAYSLTNSIQPD